MSAQGLKTSGANSFTGELGKLLKGDVQNYEVNANFEVIHNANEMRDIPDTIVKDLNKDQKYLYKIVRMVTTGDLDIPVLNQMIGEINHSRWLTTACRACRLWLSKLPFEKNSPEYQSLKLIVTFIVDVYAVMWFNIKCEPNISHGSKHILTQLRLIQKYCSEEVKEIERCLAGSFRKSSFISFMVSRYQ